MNKQEQDLILFFKLYLLARKWCYVDYMANARLLATWFNWADAPLVIIDNAPIYCGSCFEEKGRTFGGTFSISCIHCSHDSNMAYEIQQICRITGINWNLCIYLMVSAIEDIYKCNNVKAFQNLLHN